MENNKNKKIVGIILSVVVILVVAAIITVLFTKIAIGARSQYGRTGVYNNPALTLSDGEGAALAVDSSGQLIVSDSNNINVAFSATQATTIPHVSSTNISVLNVIDVGSNGEASSTIAGVYSADPCGSLTSSTLYFSIGGFPCYCNGNNDDLKIVDDNACTY